MKKNILYVGCSMLCLLLTYCSTPNAVELKPEVKEGVLVSYPNSAIESSGKVELSSDVKVIGSGAFKDCVQLKELTIQNVEQIQKNAFAGCANLKKLTLSTEPKIEEGAFANTPNDKELVVPAALEESCYHWAIKHGFSTMNGRSIASGLVTAEGKLVSYPASLIKDGKVVLAEDVTSIGEKAFEKCTELKEITGAKVRTIEARAFAGTTALSVVSFPKVETIADHAFSEATSLKEVEFPHVTTLSSFAFTGCTVLEAIRLPLIQSIGNSAFAGCSALKTVAISGKLPSMGEESPFKDTPEEKDLVTTVELNDDNKSWARQYGFSTINGKEILEVVAPPEGFEVSGRTIVGISDRALGYAYSVEIPEYFNEIADKVFANSKGYEFAKIKADGVEKVGERAFFRAENLRKVDMKNLKIVGKEAFAEIKSSLSKMNMTPSIEVIGEGAFKFCAYLELVCAPNLKEIGVGAFGACNRMQSWGVLQVGAVPPVIHGDLGISHIATLVVPKGCRATYEKWEHKDKFGKILEVGEAGTEECL